jgi:hypothetical protein
LGIVPKTLIDVLEGIMIKAMVSRRIGLALPPLTFLAFLFPLLFHKQWFNGSCKPLNAIKPSGAIEIGYPRQPSNHLFMLSSAGGTGDSEIDSPDPLV